MTKLALILSFFGLTLSFGLGLLDPNNPMMWLSSTSTEFAILRGALMAMIVTLLFTEPPRNRYLRAFVGMMSATLIGWSLGAVYQNAMPVADAFLLLSVGIASGVSVLERDLLDESKNKADIKRNKYKLATA